MAACWHYCTQDFLKPFSTFLYHGSYGIRRQRGRDEEPGNLDTPSPQGHPQDSVCPGLRYNVLSPRHWLALGRTLRGLQLGLQNVGRLMLLSLPHGQSVLITAFLRRGARGGVQLKVLCAPGPPSQRPLCPLPARWLESASLHMELPPARGHASSFRSSLQQTARFPPIRMAETYLCDVAKGTSTFLFF